MMFTVEATRRAEGDVFDILEWLVFDILEWLDERSTRGKENWWNAYQHGLKTLRESADSFGRAPESRGFSEDLHEHFFKTRYGQTYRLVFLIRAEIVYVLQVRSTGQQLLSRDEIEIPD
ncbi:MAG: hypothetical protein CMJ64_06370 [Planctomycetaceae bacterium]|jgi:plasmid stabilization system protein ParE|nr:hypothetical protein [Planctomycetaceae bacterium]